MRTPLALTHLLFAASAVLAASVAQAAAPGPQVPVTAPPPPPPLPPAVSAPPTHGTLVAVAVGGSCTFSVNGAAKGTSSQLKIPVPAGTYSVTCRAANGKTKSRSVIVRAGEPAMAMFKLPF